jgi:hypothetical protein
MQHQYISANCMVNSTNILVHKKDQNVSSTTPIRLNVFYSIGWSGAETETHVFKMAVNFNDKRTTIMLQFL